MDRMKSPWRYWFWRIYAPVVSLAMAWVVIGWLTTFNVAYLPAVLCLFPLWIAVIMAWGSSCVFPFDYSIFGKYRRTPLPDEDTLKTVGESFLESLGSYAGAGRANMGPVIWLLYRHGIGIKSVFGSVFVPLDEIDALDLEQGFDSLVYRHITANLYHHCPEIRDPIIVPKGIAKIMAAHYPSKVLVRAELAEARRE
jgi:hypothetical protein